MTSGLFPPDLARPFDNNPGTRPAPAASLFATRGSRDRRPSVSGDLLARFLRALRGRGWVRAVVLKVELNTDRRTLREAAQRSGGRILGHQRGYHLTIEASLEDVIAVTNRMHSQARAMRQRAVEIERIRHRGDIDRDGTA